MDQKVILIIIGMSIVTYLPRMLPLVILSRFRLSPLFLAWLRYIPVAVLSALLFPGLLISDGRLSLGFENKALLASLLCFFVAVRSKNLFFTVSAGVAAMLLLNLMG